MDEGLLTNRGLASLIWLGVVAVVVMWWQPARGLAKQLLSALAIVAKPVFVVSGLMYLGWLAAGVWMAKSVGLWDIGLLEPTVVWIVLAGLGFYFSFDKALRQVSFFRSALVAAVGVSAIVEFVVSFRSFPLAVELVAQPTVAVLLVAAAVADREPTLKPVAGAARTVVGLNGLVALAWVAWSVVSRWKTIHRLDVARELLMPVWLTALALIFVYGLAVYAGYEQAFRRIGWKADGRSTWRQKAAFFSVVGVRLASLRQTSGRAQMSAATETTYASARRAILHERAASREPRTAPEAPPAGSAPA